MAKSRYRTPRQQADDFIAANRDSLVISGRVLEPDPRKRAKGAVYTLVNGKSYRLGADACGLLPEGFPRWGL